MMVFMLANMVSCIVTAALLNIVDHRQVRHPTEHLYAVLCISCEYSTFIFVFVSAGRDPEQDKQKVRAG